MAQDIQENLPASQDDNKVTWGPVSAVLGTVIIYFLSQVVAVLFLSIYPIIRHWNQEETSRWFEESVGGQFALVLIVEVVTVWLLYLFLRYRKTTFRALGLKFPQLRDLGYGLLGYLFYFLSYLVILQFVQSFLTQIDIDQPQQLGFDTNAAGLELGLIFVSLVILPPLVEEIVCRGFLYTGLRKKLPKIIAAVITSIIFAAAHLQFGSGSALLWIAAIDTFILSMVLVYLRERTNSLGAPIILHMLKNGVAFATLFIFHLA